MSQADLFQRRVQQALLHVRAIEDSVVVARRELELLLYDYNAEVVNARKQLEQEVCRD